MSGRHVSDEPRKFATGGIVGRATRIVIERLGVGIDGRCIYSIDGVYTLTAAEVEEYGSLLLAAHGPKASDAATEEQP